MAPVQRTPGDAVIPDRTAHSHVHMQRYSYSKQSSSHLPTCARAGLAGGQPLEHATQLVDLNNTALFSGTLTSWRYCHYTITGTVRFQVWRRRGALQLDLVHSQSFPIFSSNGQKEHLACETYSLPKAEYVRVLSRDVFGAYVEHSHEEVIAVHVSKSRDLSQL